MNILVIGNGGREHAIVAALSKSPKVDKIYCMKGNAGIAELAELVNVNYCDLKAVGDWVDAHEDVEYTVIAPDDPLALGLADELESRGHRVFGPNKRAAAIESSKAFAKELMKKYGIPTAAYETFDDYEKALAYVRGGKFPVVLKADGLALGKGVLICETLAEAESGLKQIMLDKAFGDAGNKVVVEEFLTGKEFTPGEEVSVLAFTDGKTIVPMIPSCDHKRAYDGDRGLNTGGMGTFTPCPFYTDEIANEVMEKIMLPTVAAMNAEGRPFKGVLYFGLMRTPDGMKVVEYNSRFGDPETQVVLPMLKTDLLEIFEAVTDERLSDVKIEWEEGACVCVVLASGGYPVHYEKGKEISIGDLDEGVFLYHAGTKRENGVLKTDGGRVLGVCAKGKTVAEAREKAYANVKKIHFDGMHYRTDIGIKYVK
ncbi:MAG TPA: phosphoribosylamine--glycine ligase [Candidatus Borkfalkia excrementavium]|uniref:Phosphoribosylamine--glycine ligase n=1 Tax=Candidatus Borkfalkia excrementavium TaxID=2838505 RepID=A0A9D2CG69_9FIRM|nr:phosphoribosylamine--glycine ligase [Candidatus Borkfalkia excrementavium]